ncbi:ATP-binding cassette domain-containing protein [Nocardioides sp. JQ2195]|uniref:ATP-binding cassette domain-containing protein n=1 Tax=Nocardioides sp. JQ2195 TaxID=2592334 RepID=UPI00143E278A|nr:ATP-binding cassette domain-containing protein [Nocardioides sp. JQ2195]QIX28037.1 ATP-binding cassette domain-containing protein [Nocardioides sp. JQ2195]
MSENVVETRELTKEYGDRLAADKVSMTVRRGEVYGFLGPNGAGKTTTLRMVLGLVRPTSGSATVLGNPAGTPAVTARIGALIEGPGFFPYLSGLENLRVMARYRGLPGSAAAAALARVDLAGRGNDKFTSYSLGMKQRLGVASALMGEPDLIVLDEPTNGLDPAGMADMRALIVELARGGQSVLLSSHLLDEVQEICDRVGVINRGRLLRESTVADLRGSTHITLAAHPVDDALAVAMRAAGEDGVRLVGERIELDLADSAAPALVRDLVAAGIDVHAIGSSERSLEDVFFEMTTTPEMESLS